ncbi:MAG: transcriptional repressor [Desulfobulbaceae bacterium]
MSSSHAALEPKLARFEHVCLEAGLKLTHQRMMIFRELAAASDHPSAETLYVRLKKNLPTLSLDTVYRTLALFEELRLVSRVQTPESHARFEAEMESHHHAICLKCNGITDFEWENFDTANLPEQLARWGMIENKQVTVRGLCARCAAKK